MAVVKIIAAGGAVAALYYLWTEMEQQKADAINAQNAAIYNANLQAEQAKAARKRAILNPQQQQQNPWAPVLEWGLGEVMNRTRSLPRDSGLGGFLDRVFGGRGGGTTPTRRTPRQSAPVTRPSGAQPSNIGARLMSDLQRDFGLTTAQAAGVVGNLDHETGGFKSMQEINPVVKGSRGGYGYAQWTGPRRRQFEAWSAKNGLDVRSYEANYGFLKHELNGAEGRSVLPRLRRTNNAADAAIVFSGSSQRGNAKPGFLRPGIPHFSSRIKRAQMYERGA